jgi:hypothetical protein
MWGQPPPAVGPSEARHGVAPKTKLANYPHEESALELRGSGKECLHAERSRSGGVSTSRRD